MTITRILVDCLFIVIGFILGWVSHKGLRAERDMMDERDRRIAARLSDEQRKRGAK